MALDEQKWKINEKKRTTNIVQYNGASREVYQHFGYVHIKLYMKYCNNY